MLPGVNFQEKGFVEILFFAPNIQDSAVQWAICPFFLFFILFAFFFLLIALAFYRFIFSSCHLKHYSKANLSAILRFQKDNLHSIQNLRRILILLITCPLYT